MRVASEDMELAELPMKLSPASAVNARSQLECDMNVARASLTAAMKLILPMS